MINRRRIMIRVVAMVAVVGLGLGSFAVWTASARPTIHVGSGYVGADQASFQVDDVWFGFRSSVSWTDRKGTLHPSGWPECLPRLQEVTNVRFAGEVRWSGSVGTAEVTWVDCAGS